MVGSMTGVKHPSQARVSFARISFSPATSPPFPIPSPPVHPLEGFSRFAIAKLRPCLLHFQHFLENLIVPKHSPFFSFASISTNASVASNNKPSQEGTSNSLSAVAYNPNPNQRAQRRPRQGAEQAASEEQERVLISEVLIQNKDGEELENKELLSTASSALKASKPSSALTVKEVQEDVHRIIETGYFSACMPIAEDTRDGIRLIFQVEPNHELKGLVCDGANVLPTRIIEDSFKDEYGKIINIQRLNKALEKVNGWYMERGLFAQVRDVELLSGGIIRIQVSEAMVNNINIRFLDRKTGEPTTGKTRPETLLRQLTTKKGQVYSLQQGRRDVETVLTMGIMEDVNIVPQAVGGDMSMVDLTMNVVERVPGGFSAGGGLSGNGITSGPLAGLIGSFTYSHRNVMGKNQKLNMSVERGQVDSMFRFNYTDPWIEGDDKRTSRSITVQNSRTPGTIVHGIKRGAEGPLHGGVVIGRLTAGLDYSRPLRPKWSGTAGISFQRAGARDDNGSPKVVDLYEGPLTFSGKAYDDMLVAKLETVYTDSGDHGSSQFVFNAEQGLPIVQDWLFFNRLNVRTRQGVQIGPARCIASFSGSTVIGDLAPHEAFPIGGTNSVRGYEEGAVGSGRSCIVASGEISFPMYGPVEGAIFADYGTDLGSGQTVAGDPAGARGKPGTGYGFGAGIRVDSPLGPLRLEYALNDVNQRRFHFGIGYRN